jgi:hypothetical protein
MCCKIGWNTAKEMFNALLRITVGGIMITCRITGAGAVLLMLMVPSLLFPEPKSPAEPKAPDVQIGGDEKGRDGGKMPAGEKSTFEYSAVISYANGNRHAAVIVLPRNRIAAPYARNGGRYVLDEEISNILSVEFRGWEQKRGDSNRIYYHSSAAVTLGDKSIYMCGNVEMFNRFTVRRGKETYAGYTYFYRDDSRAVKDKKRKGGGTKKEVQRMEPSDGQLRLPHPDTVVGIRFMHGKGSKGLEDIIPLFLK